MRIIECRNVNDALVEGIGLLSRGGVPVRASRAGRVLEWPTPVATVYRRPLERVLWAEDRDANPFFHILEAMWLLAGRKDVKFPAMLLARMRDYSDNGQEMQGSYGWRWRSWFGYDQLFFICKLLRQDRQTRRAVLTMWDPTDLNERILSRDVPCNTQVYFKVGDDGKLRMTVTNRSNDMLWGAYGANAVQFAFLLEYVACKAGLPVGAYTQVSDSFHVYIDGPGGAVWDRVLDRKWALMDYEPYATGRMPVTPLGAETDAWDQDAQLFFTTFDADQDLDPNQLKTFWWRHVVVPIYLAYITRDRSALKECRAPDWYQTCNHWMKRHVR